MKMTLNGYLSEPVLIGGLQTTRGRFMFETQEAGYSRILIDRYFQGFDLAQQIKEKKGENIRSVPRKPKERKKDEKD